ncbi:MAG: hypothetical protein J7K21_05970 [Desulfurococcales archaeon]|nr:hypothetical protein [Desulfurococcales archaeon]
MKIVWRLSIRAQIIIILVNSVIFTILGTYLALFTSSKVVLPVIQLLAIIPFFVKNVWDRRLWEASSLVLIWALLVTATFAFLVAQYGCSSGGDDIGDIVYNGHKYLDEMIKWIQTGKGAEGDPSLFVKPKIIELIVFSMASLITAGIAGLAMGAILLNYMNYYYGILIWITNYNIKAILLGWPIYAILRVPGYIFLGTALSSISIELIKNRKIIINEQAISLLKYAFALIILDFILKATIANAIYQPTLNDIIDPSRLEACLEILK